MDELQVADKALSVNMFDLFLFFWLYWFQFQGSTAQVVLSIRSRITVKSFNSVGTLCYLLSVIRIYKNTLIR